MTVHDAVDFLNIVGDGQSLADQIRFHRTRLALYRARCILCVSRATRSTTRWMPAYRRCPRRN
jgi:hypothetical protein